MREFGRTSRTNIRIMADADWANSTLLRPHCHGVCLIEYDAGRDPLTDMTNWLWDTYQCTPKTSCSEAIGRWAEPMYLSHARLTGFILYLFKFPACGSCRAVSRKEWRAWLSAMECEVPYIFATEIHCGTYSARLQHANYALHMKESKGHLEQICNRCQVRNASRMPRNRHW